MAGRDDKTMEEVVVSLSLQHEANKTGRERVLFLGQEKICLSFETEKWANTDRRGKPWSYMKPFEIDILH